MGARGNHGGMSSSTDVARFNPLDFPGAFSMPEHLSAISAWVQHIPFAFFLTQVARPRVFVELGASYGDSYCAFCQAFVRHQTQSRAFAIDTWAGDVQEGLYPKDVLKMLRGYHDPRYGHFSKLLEMDFDTARSSFADDSIDLLHIDGLHTHDAVRHDFETWLPKLSDRGIVLFHDTAIRDKADFGVWKLWEEISPRYPSFMFEHGFGLGILAVGAKAPKLVLDFLAAANRETDAVRGFFDTLGQRVELMRIARVVANQLHVQQTIVDEWKQELGLPLSEGDHSLNAAFSGVREFARQLTEEMRALATEQLDRRDAGS
jgi:hypothetical protein